MTATKRSTVRMLCVRAGIAREELSEEAQKIFDLFNDPDVSPEQKEVAKRELDKAIQKLENKVETSRRLKGDSEGEKR